jgi:hypothetical protein
MSSHLYLTKANNDVISHCSCTDALVTFPSQMDCPWCGCGWLFTCIECRKAFVFARAIETDQTWEDLARRDLTNKWHESPSEDDILDWATAMEELMQDLVLNQEYVYLDGFFLPLDAKGPRGNNFTFFAGRYAADLVCATERNRRRSPVYVENFVTERRPKMWYRCPAKWEVISARTLRDAESYSTVRRASRCEKTPLGMTHRWPQQEVGEKCGLKP